MRYGLTRQWRIFVLHFHEVMQFKMRAFVWLLVGMVNTLVIVFFWQAASPKPGSGVEVGTFTTYYVFLVLLGTALMSHVEDDVGFDDIQKGKLSAYLLKPFSYFGFKFYSELVWRMVEGVFCVVIFGILFVVMQLKMSGDWRVWGLVVVASGLALVLSFLYKMIVGMSAFWVTHIHGVIEFSEVLVILFMGGILPITLLPANLRMVAENLPFVAMIYTPVALLSGMYSFEAGIGLVVKQIVWVGVFYLVSQWIWKKGLRTYGGVGQ